MKTIFFLFTSALTAAGATVVLTGTPVPHPTSFSIPLPKPSNAVPLDSPGNNLVNPVKLNLIDLQETSLSKIVDQPPTLNPTSANLTSTEIPLPLAASQFKRDNLVESTAAPVSPDVSLPPQAVDLDTLWTNSSLQKLLEKSAESAKSGINLTQALPPAAKNNLVRIEPEQATSSFVAAEPIKSTTSLIEESVPANSRIDSQPNKIEPIAKPLQNMVEESISTIPTKPAQPQNQLAHQAEQNKNLLKQAQQKMISTKDNLANRFDNLVNELTNKNPLKNSLSSKPEKITKRTNKTSTGALASIPNVEHNKNTEQKENLEQKHNLDNDNTPPSENSASVPQTFAEVKSSKPTPATDKTSAKADVTTPPSPPVQITGAPKKIAYVSWKKGYLSTDKRQLEYQYTGTGKTPVLITGSMTGRDYRNPPLMDRILYRLTSIDQLDSMAKFLIVRSPNPDGYAYGLPGNIRGVDLTKNFYMPQNQIVGLKSSQSSPTMADDKLEIETRIFMHMLREFKPELVVQIRLHPDKAVPTIEYPSRLQGRITPYLQRNSLKGLEIVQPVAGSMEHYIKTASGADYLTIHIPDHGNVDQDWLNNRIWFTELLNLCVAQEEIKNDLVAAEPIKSGPQAQDEMVSYGSVTPLSPPDPTKLEGEVEFLPPPPGKANKLNSFTVEQGFVELPAPPKKPR
jgi:hypothetical protein